MDAANSQQARSSDGKRGLETGREPENRDTGGDAGVERTRQSGKRRIPPGGW